MSGIRARALGRRDLQVINDVVASAVMAWPLPERMKRLSLPVLRYDEVDLDHFSGIGAYSLDGLVKPFDLYGVALWDEAVLHGLYVRPEAQGCGVGRSLLDAVAAQARQVGISRLLVKAARASAGYCQQLGLPAAGPETPYPYAFYLDTAGFLAFAHGAGSADRAGDHVSRFPR